MVIYFSLLVALIGLMMYILCANAKLVRIGEILFAAGVLAFLLSAREALRIIGGT